MNKDERLRDESGEGCGPRSLRILGILLAWCGVLVFVYAFFLLFAKSPERSLNPILVAFGLIGLAVVLAHIAEGEYVRLGKTGLTLLGLLALGVVGVGARELIKRLLGSIFE